MVLSLMMIAALVAMSLTVGTKRLGQHPCWLKVTRSPHTGTTIVTSGEWRDFEATVASAPPKTRTALTESSVQSALRSGRHRRCGRQGLTNNGNHHHRHFRSASLKVSISPGCEWGGDSWQVTIQAAPGRGSQHQCGPAGRPRRGK